MIADPSTPLRTRLKPYPAMKDTDVPWLGKVPEHWEVLRGRHLFEIKKRIAGELGHPILSVTQAGLRVRNVETGEGQVSQDYSKYQIVKPGDFAMNSMDLLTGGVGIADRPGVTSPDYRVFAIRDNGRCCDRYMLYVLRMLYQNRGFYAWGQGSAQLGRWRLPRKRFNEFLFPLPSLSQQAAIVRFLDHYDRKIRRYIRAKQKLIKLLEEEKQAIIHGAVTRGLDPNVRLKPSGIEWLGDIPEHWEVVALRHRYSQCLGKMLDSKRITGSHSLPYLRNTDVQWDRIKIENLPTMDIPQPEYDRYTVQKGDLLVCEGGEVGRSAIWSGELAMCGFQKALHRLRPRNPGRDVARFMYYSLRTAAKGNAFNDGHLSTIAHLTGDKLKAHRFPFPPVTEQEALVNFLDSVLKQVDQTISTPQHEISLLREYRTRLIADVVTGKLDVREAAAHLPAEPEDPEQFEEIEDLVEGEEEKERTDSAMTSEEAILDD